MLRGQLLGRQLGVVELELVPDRRLVVWMKVDPVHDVDELAKEHARSERDLPPETRGDLFGERLEKSIVDARRNALRVLARIESAHPLADSEQSLFRERQKSYLHGPKVVEAGLLFELHLHSLVQRRETLQAFVPLEEVASPGDHQIQPGKLLLRESVHQLPERVERLLPGLHVHPLHGLDLIEHHDETRVSRLTEELQKTGEEGQRCLPVDLALGARALQYGTVGVRLAGEPSEQALSGREVPLMRRPVVRAKNLRERRVAAREIRELVLEALFSRFGEPGVILRDSSEPNDFLSDLIQPSLDHSLKGVRTIGRGLEAFDEPAIHGLEVVQRRVVDRDLHLGRGELSLARLGTEVPHRERLAGPVLTANPLRETLPCRDEVELLVHGVDDRLEPRRKVFEPFARNHAASERIDDRCRLRNHGHGCGSLAWYRYIVSPLGSTSTEKSVKPSS
jgi:hypothetical protein